MTQPDTPLGRRGALLMCVLLEEGLRIGEVALLNAFDPDYGELCFSRAKVDREQRLQISKKTIIATQPI